MLAVYYITENKTKSPYKDCIIFCLYYYVFRTLVVPNLVSIQPPNIATEYMLQYKIRTSSLSISTVCLHLGFQHTLGSYLKVNIGSKKAHNFQFVQEVM